MQELYLRNRKHSYNLGHFSQFEISSLNAIYHGTESVSFLGPKVLEILK